MISLTVPTKMLHYNFHTFRWLLFEGCVQGASLCNSSNCIFHGFQRRVKRTEIQYPFRDIRCFKLNVTYEDSTCSYLISRNERTNSSRNFLRLMSFTHCHATRERTCCNRVPIKSPMSDKFAEFQLHTRWKKRIEYSWEYSLRENLPAITLFSLVSKSNLRYTRVYFIFCR